MKIDLLDIDRLIDVNKLQEIMSPKLWATKMTFDPNGIMSNEIFGISKTERRGTFAYIELGQPFIHPHIYHNVLKRLMRNVIYIVAGQRYYSIIDGKLTEDPENGWTGLSALYEHWGEIDWYKSNSNNDRSLKLLKTISRDQVFIKRLLVCPPAYRDIMISGTMDTSDHVSELNDMYTKIIRQCAILQERGLFARTQYASQKRVQDQLVDINLYFQNQISKKSGLIRKNLLGKTVDYGTRSVISAFPYNNETIHENMVDIDHAAVPISQCCSTFYPFIESWLMNFFTREIINNPNFIRFYDRETGEAIQAVIEHPELQFTERMIRKMIHNYIFNPDNRFKLLTIDAIIPSQNNRKVQSLMVLIGKCWVGNNPKEELKRPMTVTDLLYLACVDACENRHCMVTRYPVGVDKGIFFNKIRVQSTKTHVHLIFNGREYPYYPNIDLSLDHTMIGVEFVDTLVYSNSLLDGMGADFDGDQVTLRGLWTDEANLEAEKIMKKKMTALNITGGNSRVVAKEVYNSFYELTKIDKDGTAINPVTAGKYLSMTPDEFTRSFIARMFADLVDCTDGNVTTKSKPNHKTWDLITVRKDYFYEGHAEITMTVGRFLFNKYVLCGANVIKEIGIVDYVVHKNGLDGIDSRIGTLLMDDKITRHQFNQYIDYRDNLGYWLNGMLAHTISQRMLKPLKEVEARKKQLIEKHADEIAAGNIDVMDMIQKELIDYARSLLEGDPGMDLYLSGDLNFDNNYRSNAILKGPVMNNITGEFDFISSSFMSGIEIKDLPAHANSILSGAYPSAIATKESGYMGKKLLALLQMMEIDERGTDCGSKRPIPILVTKRNKKNLLDSYMVIGKQLVLLTEDNIDEYMGKFVLLRSPMSCLNSKICNKCAGERFYKLEIQHAGLFATQISYTALNLALKSKHDQSVSLYQVDPATAIIDI